MAIIRPTIVGLPSELGYSTTRGSVILDMNFMLIQVEGNQPETIDERNMHFPT